MATDQQHLPYWFIRFARFSVTGLIATMIHVAVAVSLITQLHVAPYVANGVALLTATAFSCVVNTCWSFSTRMNRRTLVRYAVVALFGGGASALVAATADHAGLDFRIGIALVIALVTPATFALHSRWTYRPSR